MRNLKDILAFYETEGRLPTTSERTARQRALGAWLHRRRQDVVSGTLSATYREALSVIPGWEAPSTWRADNETRWHRRLDEVAEYLAAGHGWPRHKGFADEAERILGVWLHVQRISHRQGKLDAARKAKLNESLPGWREGWPRSGGRAARSDLA
ncbi:helicase associated domain-containing protein [Pseudarthrobacter sp. MDT3-26]|uniref:helicase associated domain-containing protein n=1 Tax=Pseudarthrobacter raffinosi TaxID=2953651 RepID=UPI00208E7E33|nr:helicase associated domain-containing protein [Pseudarthrobacter sp. MDT3-26]MCO4263764.1 helicase associated domain-containing protein [Pseudarthrobacter sp. MDT3-26]